MCAAIFISIVCLQVPSNEPINLRKSREYFALAERLWDADSGRLWGVKLHGPLVFVDPATRFAVGTRADPGGHLKERDGVFVGTLPREVGVANYSFSWGGQDWVMFVWPTLAGASPESRAVLLMHESWHRVQKKIGFPLCGPKNDHLDATEGRYWLQLEWRALAAALIAGGPERARAVGDALLFRTVRRALTPEARIQERQLEMHEGLAEYSGVALSGMTREKRRAFVVDSLNRAAKRYPTFVRSFAYVSGPAYGVLLDEAEVEWRKGLSPENDLGDLLRNTLKLPSVEGSLDTAKARSAAYEGVALRQSEERRHAEIEEKLAAYRKLLVDGPVLTLPMIRTQMQFDPNTLQPLGKFGTVYPSVRINAAWGFLKVERGALIEMETGTVTLPATADITPRPLRGLGWELELKAGWNVVAGTRAGDWRVQKE